MVHECFYRAFDKVRMCTGWWRGQRLRWGGIGHPNLSDVCSLLISGLLPAWYLPLWKLQPWADLVWQWTRGGPAEWQSPRAGWESGRGEGSFTTGVACMGQGWVKGQAGRLGSKLLHHLSNNKKWSLAQHPPHSAYALQGQMSHWSFWIQPLSKRQSNVCLSVMFSIVQGFALKSLVKTGKSQVLNFEFWVLDKS